MGCGTSLPIDGAALEAQRVVERKHAQSDSAFVFTTSPIVELFEYGSIRGTRELRHEDNLAGANRSRAAAGPITPGIEVFKGIPYAKAGRFMLPEPPEPWIGVRKHFAGYVPRQGVRDHRVKSATDFGPDTVAASFHAANTASLWQMGLHSVDDWAVPDADQELLLPPTFAAEDMSLNLNIWTPVNTHMVQVEMEGARLRGVEPSPDSLRPVIVWIHGAGEAGQACPPCCAPLVDGALLAKRADAVVVTVNYRIGCLGFLYKPGGDIPPNIGLEDIMAALEWISKQIVLFGGDKNCVTLFGQGDGAAKVDCLLGSPVAARAGLFHRAVICSGGSLNGLCSPSYAEICARRLCEKLANAQTTLSTEAAAAEATASDSLAHAELDATRAVEGLVVATQAARDITESVKQTALTEMHGMKMSKLKKFATKHGVASGLVNDASKDADDPFGILFQLVVDKLVAASDEIAQAEQEQIWATELEAAARTKQEQAAEALYAAAQHRQQVEKLPTISFDSLNMQLMQSLPIETLMDGVERCIHEEWAIRGPWFLSQCFLPVRAGRLFPDGTHALTNLRCQRVARRIPLLAGHVTHEHYSPSRCFQPISRNAVAELFTMLDLDGDGELTLKEIKLGLEKIQEMAADLKLTKTATKTLRSAKKLFRALDVDQSRAIDSKELYTFMDYLLRDAADRELLSGRKALETRGYTPRRMVSELAIRAKTAQADTGFPISDTDFHPQFVLNTYGAVVAQKGGTDGKDSSGSVSFHEEAATRHLFTDLIAALAVLRSADAHAAGSMTNRTDAPDDSAGTFHYRFDFGSAEMPDTEVPYARHGSDIGFWFGTVAEFPKSIAMADHAPYAFDAAIELSRTMMNLLANFARTGDPSTPIVPFPQFRSNSTESGHDSQTLVLGHPDCKAEMRVENESDKGSRVAAQRRAWDGLWVPPSQQTQNTADQTRSATSPIITTSAKALARRKPGSIALSASKTQTKSTSTAPDGLALSSSSASTGGSASAVIHDTLLLRTAGDVEVASSAPSAVNYFASTSVDPSANVFVKHGSDNATAHTERRIHAMNGPRSDNRDASLNREGENSASSDTAVGPTHSPGETIEIGAGAVQDAGAVSAASAVSAAYDAPQLLTGHANLDAISVASTGDNIAADTVKEIQQESVMQNAPELLLSPEKEVVNGNSASTPIVAESSSFAYAEHQTQDAQMTIEPATDSQRDSSLSMESNAMPPESSEEVLLQNLKDDASKKHSSFADVDDMASTQDKAADVVDKAADAVDKMAGPNDETSGLGEFNVQNTASNAQPYETLATDATSLSKAALPGVVKRNGGISYNPQQKMENHHGSQQEPVSATQSTPTTRPRATAQQQSKWQFWSPAAPTTGFDTASGQIAAARRWRKIHGTKMQGSRDVVRVPRLPSQ